MKQQNINVSRYSNPEAVGYLATVEPADRSWILWVDKAGVPSLWIAVDVDESEAYATEEEAAAHANDPPRDGPPTGKIVRGYMPAADHEAVTRAANA